MTDGSLPRADDMLPPPDPGLVDRLIGTVLRRLIKGGPRPEELMEGLRASRMQSGHEQESDDVLPSTRLSPARTRRRPKSSATRTWPSACPGCSIRSGLAGRQRSGATSGAGTHSGCTPSWWRKATRSSSARTTSASGGSSRPMPRYIRSTSGLPASTASSPSRWCAAALPTANRRGSPRTSCTGPPGRIYQRQGTRVLAHGARQGSGRNGVPRNLVECARTGLRCLIT